MKGGEVLTTEERLPFRASADAVALVAFAQHIVTCRCIVLPDERMLREERPGRGMTATGTILVVDDDPAIVEFVQLALGDAGYTTIAASNLEACGVAHEMQPDLILLDILMPELDGVAISQLLRADPVTAAIPIIVMSATENLRATGSLMPVDAKLGKPVQLDRLCTTVAQWITVAKERRRRW